MTATIAAPASSHSAAPAASNPASSTTMLANPAPNGDSGASLGAATGFASTLQAQQDTSAAATPTTATAAIAPIPAATPGKSLPVASLILAAAGATRALIDTGAGTIATTGISHAARDKAAKATDTTTDSTQPVATDTATTPAPIQATPIQAPPIQATVPAPPPPTPTADTQPTQTTHVASAATDALVQAGAAGQARTAAPDPAPDPASDTSSGMDGATPATTRRNAVLAAHAAIVGDPQTRTAGLPTTSQPSVASGRSARSTNTSANAPASTPTQQPVTPRATANDAKAAQAGSGNATADTATASTATVAALPAMTGAALSAPLSHASTAPLATPTAETPTDFATLVDSIARARAESTDAAVGAATVGVTLQHADFGRVSMQFSARDEGLAVTMRSADPGFAPAVAAASASASGANTGSGGNHNPDTGRGNQADQPAAQTPSQGNSSSSSSDQATRGDSARQSAGQNSGQPRMANPSPTARVGSDAADTAGIFA